MRIRPATKVANCEIRHLDNGYMTITPMSILGIEDNHIDKIVHNKRKRATTVFFNDGDIIVVKRSKDTPHDIYNAVASAIAKKVYGNNTQFKKVLEKVEYI